MARVGEAPLANGTFDVIHQGWLHGLAGGQNWLFTSKIVAHAGGGQRFAFPLVPGSQIYQVDTVATPEDSVSLPAAKPPYFFLVYNAGANDLALYTAFNTSDSINGSSGAGGLVVTAGKFVFCACAEPGKWAVGGGSGNISVTGLAVVANLSGLRAYGQGIVANNSAVYMEGYSTANDGGQGLFVWNASSTTADDGGVTINPTWNTGNPGRFLRQMAFGGPVNWDWWGAKGDGSTNDATAILASITYATANGKTIQCSQSKDYICNSPLLFRPDIVNIDLNGSALNFSQSGGSLTCITMALDSGGDGVECENKVALCNGVLYGSYTGGGVNPSDAETMVALHASVLVIENVYVYNTGRAFDIQSQSFLVTISQCGVQGSYSGVSSIDPENGGENCKVLDSTFATNTIGIDWNNSDNCSLTVARCSFDFGTTVVNNTSDDTGDGDFPVIGTVNLVDCHIEMGRTSQPADTYPIQNTGASAKTVLIRPRLVWDGGDVDPPPLLYSTAKFPFGAFCYDPSVNVTTLWGPGGSLVSGGSGFSFMSAGYDSTVRPVNTQTANYTLALSDVGGVVQMNSGSANTLTVPPNSSVPLPVDCQIDIDQYGAGATTIVAGAGVTINSASTSKQLASQYNGATLLQTAPNIWILQGALAP